MFAIAKNKSIIVLAVMLFLLSALLSYQINGLSLVFVFSLATLTILIYASVLDLRDQEIDIKILISGLVLALVYSILSYGFDLKGILLSAISAAIIPIILVSVSREKWMGSGDILIAAWVGIITGFPLSLIAIFFAFLAGAISGIIIMKSSRSTKTLAFGPYLLIGCLLAMAFGDKVIAWYASII